MKSYVTFRLHSRSTLPSLKQARGNTYFLQIQNLPLFVQVHSFTTQKSKLFLSKTTYKCKKWKKLPRRDKHMPRLDEPKYQYPARKDRNGDIALRLGGRQCVYMHHHPISR